MSNKQMLVLLVIVPFAVFFILFGVFIAGNAFLDSVVEHQAAIAMGSVGFTDQRFLYGVATAAFPLWFGIVLLLLPWVNWDEK